MKPKPLSPQRIIMNFSTPPSAADLECMIAALFESLPDELSGLCEGVALRIEEFPEDATMTDLDIDDPYDLLALYKSGREVAPGIERKSANDDDLFIFYRRPLLDMWSETEEDITGLIRRVMIEELGRHFEFTEADIDDLMRRL